MYEWPSVLISSVSVKVRMSVTVKRHNSEKGFGSGPIVYTSGYSSIISDGRDQYVRFDFDPWQKRHEDTVEHELRFIWFTTLSGVSRIDREMFWSYCYDTWFVVVKNNPSCKNQFAQTCRQYVDIHNLSKMQSILEVHSIWCVLIREKLSRWPVTQ